MAGPEEDVSDVQFAGLKRPSVDIESLQRKKFKTDELPLTAAQHGAIDDLLHAFKKKGAFDTIRKNLWADFHDGEGKADFTKLLVELAESEIDREPELLSRERGKAATLIEGAADRGDIYKTVEKSLDALASNHLPAILESVREVRRQGVGDEQAAREETAGNKTDEDYAAHVKEKRDEREKVYEEEMRKQREIEEEEKRRKAEEQRKQREIERKKEEEERARRREREEQRRAEQRLLAEQREKEHQERYERRRREEREKYRDYDRYRDRDRSRTRDRDSERDRDRDRYRRDRSPGYRSDRGLSPRQREVRKDKSATPKEPTPAPPVDEKSLEEAALQLLLREGEELAAKARQRPEFDFEEAEAIENGLKPPAKPKSSEAKNTPTKSGTPTGDGGDASRRRGSTTEERPKTRRPESRSRSKRRFSRFEEDRPDSREVSARPRERDTEDRPPVRDFQADLLSGDMTVIEIASESAIGLEMKESGDTTHIAGTPVETGETGIENGIGIGIVMTIVDVAVIILDLAHALDTVPALAPSVGIETENARRTETGSVIMTVTMTVTGEEIERANEVAIVSDLILGCPPHPGDGLGHNDAPGHDDGLLLKVFSISIATYHRPVTEVAPLGDDFALKSGQSGRSGSEMTGRGLLRSIGIYPVVVVVVVVRKTWNEIMNLKTAGLEGEARVVVEVAAANWQHAACIHLID
ncbi:hypothetical protein FE257_000745 [Aspergillus nanangensis]|uniref:BOD1/SHG1 domain-containing protein n=1 Tax=Aspergillus nanangensis TaxID=2582783 RepID=A0AAD4CET4_ASPNN|nr:hypothetical protein FE257_000745 [Aspergillus nanangensis]